MKWLSTVLLSVGALVSGVSAHGRLTMPRTRDMASGMPEWQSNAPVAYGPDLNCRGLKAGSSVATVAKGGAIQSQWTMTAAHPGDCFYYLSYDKNADQASMKWFKIAQFRDCNLQNGVVQNISIPLWVPVGDAVLRWEWYALQQDALVEMYAQCSDITITGNAGGSLGQPLVNVPNSMIPNDRKAYRDVYNNGPFFFTGPAIATPNGGQAPPMPTLPVQTQKPSQAPPAATTQAPVQTQKPSQAPPAATTQAPVQTQKPSQAPPAGTAAPPAGQCAPMWSKCAGQGFTTLQCCGNAVCGSQSVWYSQCIPANSAAL